jgi:hypothetical protein
MIIIQIRNTKHLPPRSRFGEGKRISKQIQNTNVPNKKFWQFDIACPVKYEGYIFIFFLGPDSEKKELNL